MKNAKISDFVQPFFDEYKETILDQNYCPITSSETLMC